ncbi:hypothetical protein [Haladaptatus sp. DFWS20]|uniref:hypothetical protein n=1 Tax=Haladaptatus sp. DFWS20 TaxID=3403467 RepID=UPI003EBD9D8D
MKTTASLSKSSPNSKDRPRTSKLRWKKSTLTRRRNVTEVVRKLREDPTVADLSNHILVVGRVE